MIRNAYLSSKGTDKLRILSSLAYYYVDARSSNRDPFNLGAASTRLKAILIQKQPIVDAYDEVMNFFKNQDRIP